MTNAKSTISLLEIWIREIAIAGYSLHKASEFPIVVVLHQLYMIAFSLFSDDH